MTENVRGFTEQDLPVLVKLLNVTYRDDFEFVPYTEEKLRTRLTEGKLKILIAEDHGEIAGSVAYNDGFWGEEIEWLVVQDAANRRVIEDLLVGEAEKFVKKGKIAAGASAEDPRIAEWIERGYKPERGMYRLTVKLSEKMPLPHAPEGIVFSSLRPDEEREFVEIVKSGFGWERVRMGDINQWKTDRPPFDETWIHVAEAKGKIVSVVVARPDTEYNEFFKAKRAHLGPATTLPEYRRKDLATILTLRAMNMLFEKGYDSAALGADEQNTASLTLLNKLGFEIKHHWKIM
jgi:ribosomal protein S18 acetylase RimI-like enzyme